MSGNQTEPHANPSERVPRMTNLLDTGDTFPALDLNGGVVSLSVDDEPTTRGLIEKLRLTFPVGHSADADVISALTGAFVNPEPRFLQATGFVLDPQGRVVVSTYSSGAVGRITAADAVGLIRYAQQHAAA